MPPRPPSPAFLPASETPPDAAARIARARALSSFIWADQRVHVIEFQLVADEADEGHIQGRAVEIAIEIEQEHLQQRRAIVEGRPAAELATPSRRCWPRPTRTA